MVTLIAGRPCAIARDTVPPRWQLKACGGRMVIPVEGTWSSLEAFAPVADLVRVLYVFQGDLVPTPMNDFATLATLVIQPGVGDFTLDLVDLPKLSELSLCRRARLAVPQGCGLEVLHLERPHPDVLAVLPRLPRLHRLKIYGAFPRELPASLRVFDVAGARAPDRLSALPLLRELELTRITGLSNLAIVADSRDLARVVVEDVPGFTSMHPFEGGALETLLIGDVPLRTTR
ncbi:MAG: hypothetical protein ABR500_01290 [Dermatophilaceae bacterium]